MKQMDSRYDADKSYGKRQNNHRANRYRSKIVCSANTLQRLYFVAESERP